MKYYSMGILLLGPDCARQRKSGSRQVARAYSRCVFRTRCGAGNCGLGRDAGSVHAPRGLRVKVPLCWQANTHLGTGSSEISGAPINGEVNLSSLADSENNGSRTGANPVSNRFSGNFQLYRKTGCWLGCSQSCPESPLWDNQGAKNPALAVRTRWRRGSLKRCRLGNVLADTAPGQATAISNTLFTSSSCMC